MRMSGRRRSRPAGSPTGTMPGSGGRSCGGASSARSAPGSRPTSTREPMDGTRDGRFERRDGAERRAQLRLRARGVELGAAAGIEPHLREIERGLLVRDVAACHVELLLLAAQLEIGARDFGGDDHLRIARAASTAPSSALLASSRGARRRRSRAPRTHRSPRRSTRSRAPRRAAMMARGARLGVAAAGVDAGREIERGIATQRARFAHARERDAQVVVGGQRFVHELVELRVANVCQNAASRSAVRGVGGFDVVELRRPWFPARGSWGPPRSQPASSMQ